MAWNLWIEIECVCVVFDVSDVNKKNQSIVFNEFIFFYFFVDSKKKMMQSSEEEKKLSEQLAEVALNGEQRNARVQPQRPQAKMVYDLATGSDVDDFNEFMRSIKLVDYCFRSRMPWDGYFRSKVLDVSIHLSPSEVSALARGDFVSKPMAHTNTSKALGIPLTSRLPLFLLCEAEALSASVSGEEGVFSVQLYSNNQNKLRGHFRERESMYFSEKVNAHRRTSRMSIPLSTRDISRSLLKDRRVVEYLESKALEPAKKHTRAVFMDQVLSHDIVSGNTSVYYSNLYQPSLFDKIMYDRASEAKGSVIIEMLNSVGEPVDHEGRVDQEEGNAIRHDPKRIQLVKAFKQITRKNEDPYIYTIISVPKAIYESVVEEFHKQRNVLDAYLLNPEHVLWSITRTDVLPRKPGPKEEKENENEKEKNILKPTTLSFVIAIKGFVIDQRELYEFTQKNT